MPSVGSASRLVKPLKAQKKNCRLSKDEVIEDYKGDVSAPALTAESLQKLAEQARSEGIEQGFKEGFERGLQEGRQTGHKQGSDKAYQQARAQLEQERDTLSHIAGNLLDPMHAQQQAIENVVVDIAVHFAKEIIAQELQCSPRALVNIINKCLSALPLGASNIAVFVNEADAELVEKYLPEAHRHWRLKIDERLSSGGCRIESHESLVDYTLEHRFNAFITQIREQGEIEEAQVTPVHDYHADTTSVETQSTDQRCAEADDSASTGRKLSADLEGE